MVICVKVYVPPRWLLPNLYQGGKKNRKKQAVLKVQTGIFNTKDPDGWSQSKIDVMKIKYDPFALPTNSSIDNAINSIIFKFLFQIYYYYIRIIYIYIYIDKYIYIYI